MFIIFLKFAQHRANAGEWMEAHKVWLQQGFDEGVFIASGSLQNKQGGVILAHHIDRNALNKRLAADPFVEHSIVNAEVIDVSLSKLDPRLAFITGASA